MATPTVQTIRHLRNVGVFVDIGAGQFPHAFKQFNLIYGFNGCGKTTLSRLLDSLSEQGLSPNLTDGAEFSFELSDGSKPSNLTLENGASRYISVFNEDYIDRSLTWKDGTARPIIYLGAEQAELARKLGELEAQETPATQEETLKAAEWSSSQRALDARCRETARLIAEELSLGRRYNAANLKSDYAESSFSPSDKLSGDQRKRLKEVINRSDLPGKLGPETGLAGGDGLQEAVSAVLQERVTTIAIAALERRKDALGWIEDGLRLHKGEQHCLFCGNILMGERVASLEAALKAGFDELLLQIDNAAEQVRAFVEKCRAGTSRMAGVPEALPTFRDAIKKCRAQASAIYARGEKAGERWLRQLAEKRANPDKNPNALALSTESWDSELSRAMGSLSDEIERNNTAIDNFASEQAEARARLKAHFLADHQSFYAEAVALEGTTNEALGKAREELAHVRENIAQIRAQLRTHGPAASELNRLLASYLGHKHITLEAVEEGYRICRDGKESRKPLSEGEKTAVAFCYFVTSLAAEGRKISDLIVVLDDPISSLDTRSMTHVVGMVRKKFGAPAQIFVMTHNLDFMREMKKWLDRKRQDGVAEFLFIEISITRDGKRTSAIVPMPRLIREYESEYHYLYSLVKSLAENPAECDRFAYLMPNAIRKVLDIFLAFKHPGGSGLESKVDKVIQDHDTLDGDRVKAMERLAQLESHAESIGDITTFSGYTLEQVADAAKCLLEMIETVDPQHRKAMDRLCRP